MKLLSFLFALMVVFGAQSQVSISGGGNMLIGFGNPMPFGGFHIGLEIPRDDAVSLYGRYSHYFKQKATDSVTQYNLPYGMASSAYIEPIDPLGGLWDLPIGALASMNYNVFEGGTRYYLGNGYDYGWAAYGGTNVMIIYSKVRAEYADFDETLYRIDEESRIDGSIFSLGFGLGGGVKYTTATLGTFYLDANVNYMILGTPSRQNIYLEKYSSLLFSVNLGYRKDIIW